MFLSRLLLKKKRENNSIIHIVTKMSCIIDNWVYVYTSQTRNSEILQQRIFLNSFTIWKKELCFNFHRIETHRDQVREKKSERKETAQPGGEEKKKMLTIVKSPLSIKLWSLSINDPMTGGNRTSAGEMDVFKKRDYVETPFFIAARWEKK